MFTLSLDNGKDSQSVLINDTSIQTFNLSANSNAAVSPAAPLPIIKTSVWINIQRKNLIKRCLNNLLENSIKYGNKINIELQKKKTSIIIKVEDDGPGIAESEYDNVFKPFYKIDKGRADSKSSVGLGLSIASDIVRSHGGNIKLNKSNLNGLEVKIFLPV